MSSFWQTEGNVLLQSALTGAAHQTIDKFVNHYPFSWELAGLSAGSAFASGTVTDYIAPSLVNMSPSLKGLESTVVKPLVSGLLYAVGDKLLHWDRRGFIYEVLMQAGSQVLGTYLETPIGSALGLQE